MTYGYTLYLYPDDKASHWCEILDTMEWLTRKYSVSDCRQSNPKLHKVFLKLQRSGIRFDTVECDRAAIFVEDTVEVGSREKIWWWRRPKGQGLGFWRQDRKAGEEKANFDAQGVWCACESRRDHAGPE